MHLLETKCHGLFVCFFKLVDQIICIRHGRSCGQTVQEAAVYMFENNLEYHKKDRDKTNKG